MKYAVIDIGTNSVLMLIAETDEAGIVTPIVDLYNITRLGEGVSKTKMLKPEAMDRTFETVHMNVSMAERLGIDKTIAIGTSAMRDAVNSEEFINRVREKLGIEIIIITGEEEAELAYLSTVKEFPELNNEDVVVFDVGGGSTEFIFGSGGGMKYYISLNIGSVRMTEQFIRSDPVTEKEFNDLQECFRTELAELQAPFSNVILIGIAGTLTTLSAVEQALEPYDGAKVHKSILSRDNVNKLVNVFKSKTVEERKQLKGLEPKRADVILAGALIVQQVMDKFGVDEVIVSDRGIRYGVLYKWFD